MLLRCLSAAVAIASLIALSAGAEQDRAPIAKWVKAPDGQAFAQNRPEIASELMVEGQAVLKCSVDSRGLLENCKVLEEAPTQMGFGAAALALTPHFRMDPALALANPGNAARLPIRFTLPRAELALKIAQPADPVLLALARRVLAVESPEDLFVQRYEERARRLEVADGNSVPMASRKVASDALRQASKARSHEVFEANAALYASIFGKEELVAMVNFYESATGRFVVGHNSEITIARTAVYRQSLIDLPLGARSEYCAIQACGSSLGDLLAVPGSKSSTRMGPTGTTWSEQASFDEIAAAAPQLAKALGLAARARLACQFAASGFLRDCQITAQAPPGLGVGAAALKLAPLYRVDLQSTSRSLGQVVVMDIDFPAPVTPQIWQPPPARSEFSLALAKEWLANENLMDQLRPRIEAQISRMDSIYSEDVDPKNLASAKDAFRTGITKSLNLIKIN